MVANNELVEYTFRLRQDVAADWTFKNPLLRAGEPGVELDTGKMKMGDGFTSWSALPYFIPEPTIQALIDEAIENAELVGIPGPQGDSAYQVAVDEGFVGTEEAWLESLIGPPGPTGANGTNGTNGTAGASAYDIAVANGFVGDEEEWLESLVGAQGAAGSDGVDGADGADGESVTMTFVNYEDWPPASDPNPLHIYWRLPEA